MANTAIINASSPVVTAFLAAVFAGERLRPRSCVGVAVAVSGVIVLLSRGDFERLLAVELNQGDTLMLLSVLSWTVYALLVEQDRFCVMLLAQDCVRCSFGKGQAGPTRELHLWLQVDSSTDDLPIPKADVMLPSQHWLALLAATDNPVVQANLQSFGFEPLQLVSVELRSSGGSLALHDGSRLEWTVAGPGRGPAAVGVHHSICMPDARPDASCHRVAALISGAALGQPGELRVHGSTLEPFLLSGERLPALVHRMPKLEADIVWRRRAEMA